MGLARKQIASVPVPRSALRELRVKSLYELMHGKKPDLSSWAAGPLAAVFMWRPGKPHLRNDARAELGLYVGPCLGASSAHEVRCISETPSKSRLFVTAHVTPAPPALIPTQLLASDVITRGGTGLFGKAKFQYEQLRSLFLATPDPTGGRLLERTLALVEPFLGVPVAILDLGALAEVGIGEAVQGERTVAGGADARATHGDGAAGTGAASSKGQGLERGYARWQGRGLSGRLEPIRELGHAQRRGRGRSRGGLVRGHGLARGCAWLHGRGLSWRLLFYIYMSTQHI